MLDEQVSDGTDSGEVSDAELLRAVASGDEAAYGTLWARHADAARRFASQLTTPSNVDDLVSEGFLRVLRAVKSGGGPDSAFRPYLFNTMRRYLIDTGRSYSSRITLTEDETVLDLQHSDAAGDVYSADSEQRAAWLAWASLPDETRTLLWHLVIEEETPAQVAPLLGVSPNGVSSRAVRARERLRQAFLNQHLAAADNDECRRVRTLLGAYVRDALASRDRSAVENHLGDCKRCSRAVAELRDLNGTLRAVVAPLVLGGGGVAAAYLASGHAAASGATAAAHATLLSRVASKAPQVKIAAAAATVGVCTAGAIAYTSLSGPAHTTAAVVPLKPIATMTSATPTPTITSTTPTPTHRSSPRHASPTHRTAPPSQSVAARSSAPSSAPSPTTPPTTKTATHAPAPPASSAVSPSPSPTPSTQQRTVTIQAPDGQQLGTVTVAAPNDWSITSVATPRGLSVPGGAAHDATWQVPGSTLSFVVVGPPQSQESLQIDATTSAGPQHFNYPLG
jgi:RNA polymerase sigma factor (sigma-70 family)